MLIFLLILWVIGAVLCVKADAMQCNNPTEWSDVTLSLVCWPIVAILICTTRHVVYVEGRYKDREYKF